MGLVGSFKKLKASPKLMEMVAEEKRRKKYEKPLSFYENLIRKKAMTFSPSKEAQYRMQQAELGADVNAANQMKQMMAQTGSAYNKLGAGATGARENLGLYNVGRQALGNAGIYGGLLTNQINLMGEDVAKKQGMLQDIMNAKAQYDLGKRQAEDTKHRGGLLGGGGFLGTGL